MKTYVHRPRSSEYLRLEREALNRGSTGFGVSNRGTHKYFVIYKNRTIHFGHKYYEDFTIHKDQERRNQYRARHMKILLKDGTPAYTVKTQPAYWSYFLLWS